MPKFGHENPHAKYVVKLTLTLNRITKLGHCHSAMAFGLKVLVVLFVILSFAVAIFVVPPDSLNKITCFLDVQGCMMSGGMGIPGSQMMVPWEDWVDLV